MFYWQKKIIYVYFFDGSKKKANITKKVKNVETVRMNK